jgi:maleamate amidohydrolase
MEITQYLADKNGIRDYSQYAAYDTEPRLGSRPAVIMIDFYRLGTHAEATQLVITQSQQLVALARSHSWPIVWITRDWQRALPSTLRRQPPRTDEQLREAYAIDPRFDTQQDIVIAKPRASAYHDTALDTVLTQLGTDSVIYAGHSTAGCVRATVTEGFTRGRPQVLVLECVFCGDPRAHWSNLWDLHHRYAPCVQLSQLAGLAAS